jgi:hypothetical protein
MAWILVVFVALIAFMVMVDLWAAVLSRFREGRR